jgi:hypothetical protein
LSSCDSRDMTGDRTRWFLWSMLMLVYSLFETMLVSTVKEYSMGILQLTFPRYLRLHRTAKWRYVSWSCDSWHYCLIACLVISFYSPHPPLL